MKRASSRLLKVPIVFLNDPLKNGLPFESRGQNDVPLISISQEPLKNFLMAFSIAGTRGNISNKRFGFLVDHSHYITIF